MNSVKQKNCAGCGEGFACGAEWADQPCWCDALPHLPLTAIEGRDCLCPRCLSDAIASLDLPGGQEGESIRGRTKTSVHPQISLTEGADYYLEGSALVFTAGYHLRRGYCCENGCRHCPYT